MPVVTLLVPPRLRNVRDDGPRQQVVTWSDPLVLAARSVELSGLDFLRNALLGEIPLPPIAALLGFSLLEVEPGRVVFCGEPREQHYNGFGTVHGGFASALFDCALPCAIATTLDKGVMCGTTDLHVRFVRPLTMLTGPLTCEGIVVHRGRTHATAEGRLTDKKGTLFGHATTGCSIIT